MEPPSAAVPASGVRSLLWRAEQAALLAKINTLTTTSQRYDNALTAIENLANLCQEFLTQPPSEQWRLLKILVKTAT